MKLSMYSIYDTIAEVFNKPFTDINDGTAIRNFKQSVADQPHKNDYVLYKLGEFTDHNGQITSDKNPEKIFTGFDVQKAEVVDLPEALREQGM